MNEMGRVVKQSAALVQRLVDEPDVATFEVAQAAVNQFGGKAAGARGEVALVDHPDAQTTQDRVEGHAGPGDAAAKNQQVEGSFLEGTQAPFHGGILPGISGFAGLYGPAALR